MEKESEAEPKDKQAMAEARRRAQLSDGTDTIKSSPEYRDMMRVYATHLLAHFVHVDPSFRYKFFNDFCVASIKAERSLRASLVQRVLGLTAQLRFSAKLEPILRSSEVLHKDEVVVAMQFVEHSIGMNADKTEGVDFEGVKLLILTNKSYLISSKSYPWDTELDILNYVNTPAKMLAFASFERRDYVDIIRLYRDSSGQVMGIHSFTQSRRERIIANQHHPPGTVLNMPRETHIFLHRGQGVVDHMLTEIAKRTRDDANRIHQIASDDFSPLGVTELMRVLLSDMTRATVKLMTYVYVVKRDASIVPRLLLWLGSGKSQYIVVTSYSLHHWRPEYKGTDSDRITLAAPWSTESPIHLDTNNTRSMDELKKYMSAAESKRLKQMFNCGTDSSFTLFNSMNLPASPLNLGPTPPFFFPISEIQSIDFSEDIETDMTIRIQRVEAGRIPSVYIRFLDDTGREVWRRKFKEEFYSGDVGSWKENILPDLSEGSRRKQELL